MTTSLVTGAAGFIGSTLAETLIASGDTVIGIDSFLDYYDRNLKEENLAKLRESDRFELVEGSIQDQDLETLLRRCDRLFHLAAQAGVRASWGTEFSIYTTNNILATQKLLEAAISSGGLGVADMKGIECRQGAEARGEPRVFGFKLFCFLKGQLIIPLRLIIMALLERL